MESRKINRESIKFAILLFLITNRGLLGDFGLLAFYIICMWFIIKDGLYMPVFNYLLWLLIPIGIGFALGFFNHGAYDVFKDIYYFLSPVFTVYVGCIIAQRTNINVLKRSFLIVGITIAFIYIVKMFATVGTMALLDPRLARYESSLYVSCAVLLPIGVLLWEQINSLDGINRQYKYRLLFLVNFIAIYISGSRTFWFTTIVYILVVTWPYIRTRLLRFSIISILIIGALGVVLTANSDSETTKILLHSMDEMTATDFTSARARNNNYRAYETYRAMQQFEDYSWFNQCLGAGFGEKIDLIISPLGTRYIPILHNAYPYILIKVGYWGMLCFFIFGFSIVRMVLFRQKNENLKIKMFCYMAVGGIIVSFIMNGSVWGLFNSEYNILLMLSGICIYYLNRDEEDETKVLTV